MQYLIGTDSVHTTAAICDYLDDRADSEDAITAVAVEVSDEPTARRDCLEALNVASVRLAAIGGVETDCREGDPAEALLDAAGERGVDEIVIGNRSGRPDATADLGSTAQAVLSNASHPVVVVPVAE